jgi:endonuclease-3
MNKPESQLRRRVTSLIARLNEFYPVFKPKPKRDPLDELVLTILSQNTNDNNSFEAFTRLKKKYKSWEEVVKSKRKDVEETLSVAGLAPTKTGYILDFLNTLAKENIAKKRLKKGSPYHLDFIRKMNFEDALTYLTSFKGVGQKTAACVLAFSCGMPSFPVDTHIYRILKRQGIVPLNMTTENAHHLMYQLTNPDDRYRLHLNLIHYGREICHARNPECVRCVIKKTCVYLKNPAN